MCQAGRPGCDPYHALESHGREIIHIRGVRSPKECCRACGVLCVDAWFDTGCPLQRKETKEQAVWAQSQKDH